MTYSATWAILPSSVSMGPVWPCPPTRLSSGRSFPRRQYRRVGDKRHQSMTLGMSGARPLYLSAGFILEEGLPLDTLGRIVASMAAAAQAAGVIVLVTGGYQGGRQGARRTAFTSIPAALGWSRMGWILGRTGPNRGTWFCSAGRLAITAWPL